MGAAGFVDTHRHTWQSGLRAIAPDTGFGGYLRRILGELAPRYRPEDVYLGNLAGALESLNSGVTTLLDWSHIQLTPDHTAAAVDALLASGVRGVFGYSYGAGGDPEELVREGRRVFETYGGAVEMAVAALGPDIAGEQVALAEWRLARELDLPITTHMGIGSGEHAQRGLDLLDRHGMLGPRTTYVHATGYSDEALKRIAASGGSVSVAPLIENALGMGEPVTERARAAGVPTGLGVDAVTSGPGDMFSVMRSAYSRNVSTRDVLRMATIEGAQVVGLGDVAGSLRPGKRADLMLLRTDTPGMAGAHDPIGAVVLNADTSAVDTVLVGGRIVKRGGRLLHHDVQDVFARLGESGRRIAGS